MSLSLDLACILVLLIAAAAAAPFARARAASAAIYGVSLAVCVVLLVNSLAFLVARDRPDMLAAALPLGLPWIAAQFRVDTLSAFFLLIVNLGGAAASLYGIGHGRHEPEPGRVLPFYPAFLAGMNLVLLAGDAFTFLFSWELMSLASWALVMAHHREPGNAQAGYVYLLMASFGTLALLLAFGLLAGAGGDYVFEAIRARELPQWLAALVLALTLLGAGSKAGLVPLHVWLPLAHPAAPSHVSALMSGVMTKVAVYAVLRILFDLLGGIEWWWATIVLLLGGVTAAMGVLYALMQNDLKRLLAYSTVENIGVLFVGIGLALGFQANDMREAAALALTAALFHAFNHSLFKGLLFLGAGAVLDATGQRDLDRLGGLIHAMPLAAFVFLVGSTAAASLPPLNGFASEWLLLQAILVSPDLPQWLLRFLVPAIGALLVLAAGLAATAMVKAFGIAFLGRPRSAEAETAHDPDRFSLAAMAVLAGLCVLAGLFPVLGVDLAAPAARLLTASAGEPVRSAGLVYLVPVAAERSSYSGLLVFLFIGGSAWAAALLIHRLASRALRRSAPWDCGFPGRDPAFQYSAGSFAQPLRRVFGSLVFRAVEKVEMPPPGDPRPARFTLQLRDPVWDWLFAPVAGLVDRITGALNYLQFLTIRRYLGMMFAALIILLSVVAIWR